MTGQLLPTVGQLLSVIATVVLCGLIGLEREVRRKDAGIRTHILVGLGAALFTMVSLYGAPDSLPGNIRWDAARIAAQVVSGIGFIGAGVIFFHRDTVRGLTTAAAIWVAAAVGMAAGAQMFGIAVLVVVFYFVAILGIAPVSRRLLRRSSDQVLRVTYEDGHGILRQLLLEITAHGFETRVASTRQVTRGGVDCVEMRLHVFGGKDFQGLLTQLAETAGVTDVEVLDSPE